MNIVERATEIATHAHEGQLRKSDGTPYIAHPLAVGELLRSYGFGELVIAAGIAHDILEDTDMHEAELRAELGDEIVDVVLAVSEDKSLEWEERKQQYIETVTQGSEAVKAVSVADKIHNATCFLAAYAEQGPDLWSKFNRGPEKTCWFQRTLLEELKKTWDHPMLKELEPLVEQLEDLE